MGMHLAREDSDHTILRPYLDSISCYPLLKNYDEEAELARRGREGDEKAYTALVTSNLRLVVYIAKNFTHRGIPFQDLIQEGNLGLVKAAHKYDENRGVRFASYATWWIRQSILHVIYEEGRGVVRLPHYRSQLVNKQTRFVSSFQSGYHREPSDREIAEALGISEEMVSIHRGLALPYFSLSATDSDSDSSSIDLPSADGAESITEILNDLDHIFLKEELEAMLSSLSPRESRVVRLYFGIGEDPHTLASIGRNFFGCTKENVRQIKYNALKRLRQNERIGQLEDYL